MFSWESNAGWNSEYDSTWEDEEVDPLNKPPRKKMSEKRIKAARDLQKYRHGYGQSDNDDDDQEHQQPMLNLAFYQNRIKFEPDGVTIEEFHQNWRTDYAELEENHCFIQWLFPLREPGVNPYAPLLTIAEIKKMKADQNVMKRLLESYKIMLGFYGILLLDENTGKVTRAENYKERFRLLNRNTHNNLRITRILKCLGEIGFERLQAPLVQFFLEETLCNNKLPDVKTSALDYFIFTVKDKNERRKLVYFAWNNYKGNKTFFWGPVDKLQKLKEEEGNRNQGTAEESNEAAESADVDSINNASNPTGSPGIHHNLYQPQEHQQVTGIEGSLEVVGAGSAFGEERLEDHEIEHGEASGYRDLTIEGNNPEDIGTGTERQTTEVTEDASIMNEDLPGQITEVTEDASIRNEDLPGQITEVTEDTSIRNEDLPGQITEYRTGNEQNTVAFQPESPINEERFKLLPGTEDQEMDEEQQNNLWDQCLSLNRFCCHVCLCSHCT